MHKLLIDPKLFEIIKKRRSWRTYSEKPVEKEIRERIRKFASGLGKPPFGSEIRFELLDLQSKETGKVSGTYGVIKGAKTFIAGAAKHNPGNLEDFGFLFEQIILFITFLDLNTCWMGLTFSTPLFSEKMGLSQEEIMPCISPVGYRAEKRSLTDTVFHASAGSKKRKPWQTLFFDSNFRSPLIETDSGELAVAFEMVRLAPSALNKQPWRLTYDGNKVHFFLYRTAGVSHLAKTDLQRIDMGIAMCHFELAAKTAGIDGEWVAENPDTDQLPKGVEYIASWQL